LTNWDALLAVCGYLKSGLLRQGNSDHSIVPWELIIEASSHHLVIPALAWCLEGRPEVPPDIQQYFAAILQANRERNQNAVITLNKAVQTFNQIDIQPVLLKGAAHLLDDTYPDAGLRFICDLDLLVPPDRSEEAYTSLQAAGWQPNTSYELPDDHHHLPMIHDPETGIGVEVHTSLLPGELKTLIPNDWFRSGVRSHQVGGLNVFLPDPTRSVAHLVAHDQLLHENYWHRKLELRQGLELVLLRKRHEKEIAWPELEELFARHGLSKALATFLNLSELLFGMPTPSFRHGARLGARAELRWRLRPRWWQPVGRLSIAALEYILDRCHEPAGLLRLLTIRAWRHRVRRLAGLVKAQEARW
jgi:Uncharacterised nucleotidyltransferase